MKRYLKKDRVKFEKEINAFFSKHQHLKPRRMASDYIEDYPYLRTKYGVDYEIRRVEAGDNLLNVMGAFEGDKETYARIRNDGIDCNPFTGKWNFHLSGDIDEVITHIKQWFLLIMGKDEERLKVMGLN